MNYIVIVWRRGGGMFWLRATGDLVPCVQDGKIVTIPEVPAAALGGALAGIIDNENYRRVEINDADMWRHDPDSPDGQP